MQYDFNKVINRRGTYSTQWDYIQDRFGRSDILPFSISDTDFPVPVGVQEALEQRIKHPIYGYTLCKSLQVWQMSQGKQEQ